VDGVEALQNIIIIEAECDIGIDRGGAQVPADDLVVAETPRLEGDVGDARDQASENGRREWFVHDVSFIDFSARGVEDVIKVRVNSCARGGGAKGLDVGGHGLLVGPEDVVALDEDAACLEPGDRGGDRLVAALTDQPFKVVLEDNDVKELFDGRAVAIVVGADAEEGWAVDRGANFEVQAGGFNLDGCAGDGSSEYCFDEDIEIALAVLFDASLRFGAPGSGEVSPVVGELCGERAGIDLAVVQRGDGGDFEALWSDGELEGDAHAIDAIALGGAEGDLVEPPLGGRVGNRGDERLAIIFAVTFGDERSLDGVALGDGEE